MTSSNTTTTSTTKMTQEEKDEFEFQIALMLEEERGDRRLSQNGRSHDLINEPESKEPESEKENNPWYEYNIENSETLLNETIVTLRLTKKHYKTAYTLAHLLGFKSLDDYISNIVVQNIEMEIDGGGDIQIDNVEREKLF